MLGINGKNSELHAAMGLCLLPRVPAIIERRAALHQHYRHLLAGLPLRFPLPAPNTDYNFAYFPVLFESEAKALEVKAQLAAHEVDTRRYFFPSLNRLPYHTGERCPLSEDASGRVLCLPFYPDLSYQEVRRITGLVRAAVAPRVPAGYFYAPPVAAPVAAKVRYTIRAVPRKVSLAEPAQRQEPSKRFPLWEEKKGLGGPQERPPRLAG
jgi:hypothetical protein